MQFDVEVVKTVPAKDFQTVVLHQELILHGLMLQTRQRLRLIPLSIHLYFVSRQSVVSLVFFFIMKDFFLISHLRCMIHIGINFINYLKAKSCAS